MKKKSFLFLLVVIFLCSCEEEDDFSPSELNDLINLEIINDNSPADGVSKVRVRAVFPSDFNTADQDSVRFTVYREISETIPRPLALTSIDGEDKKMAELEVSNKVDETLRVLAAISVSGALLSKETEIQFRRAYLDSINVFSDSLVIRPNSFNEITFTTELLRNTGVVSKNSIAETRVIDTLGVERGIFNNYKNATDTTNTIINKFTLGNDTYVGRLIVIAEAITEQNEQKIDSLTIFSQE